MDLGIKGKVALVAGASKGLGRVVALGLAREGVSLALCARDEEHLIEAATAIAEETKATVWMRPTDVSRPEETSLSFGRQWHIMVLCTSWSTTLVAPPRPHFLN